MVKFDGRENRMRHFRVMTFSISLHWGHLCHVDTFLVRDYGKRNREGMNIVSILYSFYDTCTPFIAYVLIGTYRLRGSFPKIKCPACQIGPRRFLTLCLLAAKCEDLRWPLQRILTGKLHIGKSLDRIHYFKL